MILQETDRTLVELLPNGKVKKTYKKLSVKRFLEITSCISGSPAVSSITASEVEKSYIMDYVPHTLTEYIKLFPNQKIALVQKIAVKLFGLWQKGVVHGDFHANNILVNEAGEPFFIDFERSCSVTPNTPFCHSPDLIGPKSAFWDRVGKKVDVHYLNHVLGVNSSKAVEFVKQYLIEDIKNSGGAYWENASKGQIYGSYDQIGRAHV